MPQATDIGPYLPELAAPTATLRIGSRGPAVKRLQEWLGLRGHGVGIDGDFGPATAAALKALMGMDYIEPGDWMEVCLPLGRAVSTVGGGPIWQRVVNVAEAHLAEHPVEVGGDNRGPWVRHYCRGYEVAWCQGFASSVWLQAGAYPMDLVLDGVWCLYVPRMVTEARAKGLFTSGDAGGLIPAGSMFFVRGGPAGYSHVGIVVEMQGDTFTSIEGNTSEAGGSNGFEVCRRTRARRSCDFARSVK